MSHSFYIPTWVLFFLISSSLTIQIQLANGDIVEEGEETWWKNWYQPTCAGHKPNKAQFSTFEGARLWTGYSCPSRQN
ncbi:hypothetical protein MA16_Dca024700 [Dendrobium catenatum]|uniref:Alpha-carbonic anhydrase domain-containing protein n=1 Tax=Dendrobium catenatum TaxID=906689 RepID=A0A2I0WS23_9ASPA|nr:hypothetical protein MA16_Dca024700 [Dendrobium catenatum]